MLLHVSVLNEQVLDTSFLNVHICSQCNIGLQDMQSFESLPGWQSLISSSLVD